LAAAFVFAASIGFGLFAQPEGQSSQSGATLPARRPADDGYTDTPMLPGLPWRVHDPARPQPVVVTPGAQPGAAPVDAVVLFDGRDLSRWGHRGAGASQDRLQDPKWAVRDGYVEAVARTGSIYSRDSFGDVQLHIEWAAPASITAHSQARGNSGIFLMSLYEVQVLDSYDNRTYADGHAGAIYGQWPPLVNAARKPGDWQTFDIVFEAPRFENGKVVKPAFLTVFWNGVVVHHRREVSGPTAHRTLTSYATPHAAELPLMLQDHGDAVRYRNIWVRRLGSHDQPR
jgi:hypothetical protein